MQLDMWIRWYMVVFFTLFGAWFLVRRSLCARAGALIRVGRDGSPWTRRLGAAVERRERIEGLRTQTAAYVCGGVSLLAAFTAALAPVPVTMLYALVCVVLATSVATVYERLRRAGGPRVASLRARDPNAVAPWYAYALTATAAVSPLAYLSVAPAAAVLVTVAGMLIAAVGCGVASSPALISGDDVAVEQYVDDRLRTVRTVNLLATACAPAFVFSSFTGYTDSPLHVAVELVTFAAFAVTFVLQIALMRRPPRAVEIDDWSRSGA